MTTYQQFYALMKPRVIQLIVFCAFVGMLLAVDGTPTAQQWFTMFWPGTRHVMSSAKAVWISLASRLQRYAVLCSGGRITLLMALS